MELCPCVVLILMIRTLAVVTQVFCPSVFLLIRSIDYALHTRLGKFLEASGRSGDRRQPRHLVRSTGWLEVRSPTTRLSGYRRPHRRPGSGLHWGRLCHNCHDIADHIADQEVVCIEVCLVIPAMRPNGVVSEVLCDEHGRQLQSA